jgi:putative peptidoglycan lipid II flippase
MRPLVQFVFEGRAFTAENTTLVVLAAQMFLVGLVGHSLVEVAARTFYARQDARTPFFAAWATMIVFVALCYLLIPMLGHGGIALANSLAFTAEGIVLLAILQRRHGDLDLRAVGGALARVAGATALMAAVVGGFIALLGVGSPLVLGAGGALLAVLVYLPLAFLLLPEFRSLPALVLNRIR